eukprot:COSAG05_NODE_2128_length_3517_cov_7.942657_3_plen_160_part_00
MWVLCVSANAAPSFHSRPLAQGILHESSGMGQQGAFYAGPCTLVGFLSRLHGVQRSRRLARRKDHPCTGELLIEVDDLVRQLVKPAEILEIGMYVPKEALRLRRAHKHMVSTILDGTSLITLRMMVDGVMSQPTTVSQRPSDLLHVWPQADDEVQLDRA